MMLGAGVVSQPSCAVRDCVSLVFDMSRVRDRVWKQWGIYSLTVRCLAVSGHPAKKVNKQVS